MAKRVLVTGAAGFLGRHVCRHLRGLSDDIELTATDIATAVDVECDRFVSAELTTGAAVAEIVRTTRPECILHLAGLFGGDDVLATYRVNVLALVALLDAVRQHAPEAVVITTGTAAEYGRVAERFLPITEDCPCAPVTPYGHSKLLATQTALHYHRSYGLATMVVRPFQLLGRGIAPRLAPGAFASQLEKARTEGRSAIQVGNLESRRDFLDVRDAAAALWELCRQPAPGEVFNVCSGQPTKMADLLDAMIRVAGAEVRVEVDPARLRGDRDVSAVYGSHERLTRHSGWRPQIGLEQSVTMMMGGQGP